MHETGLVRDLIHKLDERARAEGAIRVSGAKVWLGALSHLSAEHFREHFEIESRGTAAEGTILTIEVSDDLHHPHAQDLMLTSLDLEV